MLDKFLNKVFHADALALLGKLPSESIDAILVDPMFGSTCNSAQYEWGADPGGGDPDRHWAYHQPIYEECRRVLKPEGALAWSSSFKYAMPNGKWNSRWFGPHSEWVITRKGLHVWHEQLAKLWLVQTKEQAPIPAPAEVNAIVWYDRLPKKHPCPKPWQELAVLVNALTRPGQVILDCFCGAGSTLVAAEWAGRQWIGGDRSAHYCRIAMRELAKLRRQRKSSHETATSGVVGNAFGFSESHESKFNGLNRH